MSKKVNEKKVNVEKEKENLDWGGGSFPDPRK